MQERADESKKASLFLPRCSQRPLYLQTECTPGTRYTYGASWRHAYASGQNQCYGGRVFFTAVANCTPEARIHFQTTTSIAAEAPCATARKRRPTNTSKSVG